MGVAIPPIVALRGIVKRFGDFTANDHIDLDICGGEAHALIGENGAGKSTLMKILYGLLEPTDGVIEIDGVPKIIDGPETARRCGIGMVFQHFSLFENLTVAENIALVLPAGERMADLETRIRTTAARYRLALEPQREVWTLSAGERQRIEILRCLLQDPRLIILDEPTSVLTPQEAEALFETLDRLKSEGRALLYISHKLDEVKRLCDRATILRLGKVVGTCVPRDESARSMAAMMVGTQIAHVEAQAVASRGAERLTVEHLSLAAEDLHGVTLQDVSIHACGGEVLGIAGVAGNGQSELFATLSGERLAHSAKAIRIDGQPVGLSSITQRRLMGAAFVPEERNGHAAAPNFALSENTVLSRHATGGLARSGFIMFGAARGLAERIIRQFDVRRAAPDPAARTLSGGNLQKFVVGREILREPSLLIINQPTWGVDAAASAAIRQALIDLSRRGAAVIVISQDLDELFEMCDRIAVIHSGHLSEPLPARSTTREEIGLIMTGTGAEGGDQHAH